MTKTNKVKVKSLKDQPRFNLIKEYEKEFKSDYATIFALMMGEIKKKLKDAQ